MPPGGGHGIFAQFVSLLFIISLKIVFRDRSGGAIMAAIGNEPFFIEYKRNLDRVGILAACD